jgi:L-asparaginase II
MAVPVSDCYSPSGDGVAEAIVEVWRGSAIESRHRICIAVCDAEGQLRAQGGNVELVVYARSSVKPLQALPLVEDGVAEQFGLTSAELALCCASHGGEPRHINAAESILRKIGAAEEALACGPHTPLHEPSARELRETGREPTRVHNNCSGKHAGMLALARFHGWPLAGYHTLEHPVQQRMLAEIARWTALSSDEILTAVDGCGVVTFAVPLSAFAQAFARFAAAARRGDGGPARIVSAMTRNPEYVGGSGRLCTELMRTAKGRLFVKVGAEGVFLAGAPGAELGIAVKVEDGAQRAAEPALIRVLRALNLLSDDEVAELDRFAEPVLHNTRGEAVGLIRTTLQLEPGNG